MDSRFNLYSDLRKNLFNNIVVSIAGNKTKIFVLKPADPRSIGHFEYFFLSLAISFEFEFTGDSLEVYQWVKFDLADRKIRNSYRIGC